MDKPHATDPRLGKPDHGQTERTTRTRQALKTSIRTKGRANAWKAYASRQVSLHGPGAFAFGSLFRTSPHHEP